MKAVDEKRTVRQRLLFLHLLVIIVSIWALFHSAPAGAISLFRPKERANSEAVQLFTGIRSGRRGAAAAIVDVDRDNKRQVPCSPDPLHN